MNQQTRLEILLEKENWNSEERQWLLRFLESSDESELRELMLKIYSKDLEGPKTIDPRISEKMLAEIHKKTGLHHNQNKARLLQLWVFRVAAACFFVFIIFGICVLVKNKDTKQQITKNEAHERKYKNDVSPGGNKAMLTLADGSTMVLDDAKNGTIFQQGNTKIIKVGGKLNYKSSALSSNENLFNVVATPRGGQYKVELPDGSLAWLNSSSSLRFPVAFLKKERRIEITGEVYFEVAKDKTRPFLVSVNGAEIQVLGTHFNVMAYNDEATLQTTLLEGAVKIIKAGNISLLRPGQQSQITKTGHLSVINDVDLTRVVAWKNGFFDFEGSDFETIAKQLSRWYDVEFVYSRKVNDQFFAEIPRNTKLSDVLKALELTGRVSFEIEGKRVIVMP